MSEVRKLPAVDERVETGPIQFGDDWPGLFMRGDSCMYLLQNLNMLKMQLEDSDVDINPMVENQIDYLIEMISKNVIE